MKPRILLRSKTKQKRSIDWKAQIQTTDFWNYIQETYSFDYASRKQNTTRQYISQSKYQASSKTLSREFLSNITLKENQRWKLNHNQSFSPTCSVPYVLGNTCKIQLEEYMIFFAGLWFALQTHAGMKHQLLVFPKSKFIISNTIVCCLAVYGWD